jgi:hypothetical protein
MMGITPCTVSRGRQSSSRRLQGRVIGDVQAPIGTEARQLAIGQVTVGDGQ